VQPAACSPLDGWLAVCAHWVPFYGTLVSNGMSMACMRGKPARVAACISSDAGASADAHRLLWCPLTPSCQWMWGMCMGVQFWLACWAGVSSTPACSIWLSACSIWLPAPSIWLPAPSAITWAPPGSLLIQQAHTAARMMLHSSLVTGKAAHQCSTHWLLFVACALMHLDMPSAHASYLTTALACASD
jgi:hypothetical protein